MPQAKTITSQSRFSLIWKLAGALVLFAAADLTLYGYGGGSGIGLFALTWLAVVALVRPASRKSRGGWITIGCGALFAGALAHNPGLLGAVLFLAAIGSTAVLRGHVFDHVGLWTARLTMLRIKAPFRPLADVRGCHF